MRAARGPAAPGHDPPTTAETTSTDVDTEFSRFAAANTMSLLRTAYLLTGDQQLAEDLVQESLARTYLSWRRLHHRGNAAAYTRKVMYHRQVSWWRRRKVAETLTDTMPTTPAPGRDLALELAIRQAVLRLHRAHRAVIVLRFFEDQTETEIAQTLGLSRSTVHHKLQRALKRLAELVPELRGELS
ncbi:RNA polymerase sigma-70 factor (sigma-E family) [Stackebrandtia albiflava]|uniref:RNA polymerase sigma-70 factor (Sigma-E family) n=2 Tax=Stackebrandtia albiflava TaxID=406432 RepID=A0A562V491_9ACTN|nr:RNA polymerase sigma-70 factor (sigma-E family) [Stackebrandtia albiflava]